MPTTIERHRTLEPKMVRMREALSHPQAIIRELNNRSFYHFLQYFWPCVSNSTFSPNWHIEYMCTELERLARRVGERKPREYDLIINVPPGSTKTITCSIMFPVWCWAHVGYWMRFICASYSQQLSLESAEYCRELVRSTQFQEIYPMIDIKEDKDTRSNFKIVKRTELHPGRLSRGIAGGSRYSTSVGGTLTGFHGDILIVDDPLDPRRAASDIELGNANHWMEQTLSTRKTDKAVTPTILIMQRLHQDDPTGHMLSKEKANTRHVCIPGEIRNWRKLVNPPELAKYYKDDLLDPVRTPWTVLADMEADLGQYGYAGQVGQDPTPPGGGMFKVDCLEIITQLVSLANIVKTVRYWDKAGTQGGGDYTVGVKMSLLRSGKWIIEDVKRGRWGTSERESVIRQVAEADGPRVHIWIEQEPGSGGKESAEGTVRNLGGFSVYTERPTGDKVYRADPFSVQVNNHNVQLLIGAWHREFIDELRFFPHSTHKDQVDAASGAFSHLVHKRIAGRVT